MIDYEKLKEAHELLTKEVKEGIITATVYSNMQKGVYYRIQIAGVSGTEIYTMDELLTKIKSLIPASSKNAYKYKLNQEVWYLVENEMMPFKIVARDCNKVEVTYYNEDDCYLFESEAYPSREALIDAQIKHWNERKVEVESTGKCEKEEVAKYSGATMCSCDHLIVMSPLGQPLICEKCGADMSRVQLDWRSQG